MGGLHLCTKFTMVYAFVSSVNPVDMLRLPRAGNIVFVLKQTSNLISKKLEICLKSLLKGFITDIHEGGGRVSPETTELSH